ncbi:hypothetical protein [Tumebacillus lipolyticus]|uniref:EamA domain-containing protein n=1 Tax=Tumebacillus lipolyticus TaxID=1280370 RepID=A0ABW4ZUD9_9BACL
MPTGAIIDLYLLSEPLSVSAMISILMLIGIVVHLLQKHKKPAHQ